MPSRIAIREFEELYCGEQTVRRDKVYLSKVAYSNLRESILDESTEADISKVLSIHSRHKKEFIKASKYVGVIQTSDGTTIEILPKIYSAPLDNHNDSVQACGLEQSKQIFLSMLKHFTDENGVSFQVASLEARDDFPILEAYISHYLRELETLIKHGLKKDYRRIEEVSNCLKGKLVVQKQAVLNAKDRTKFVVNHYKYQEDIPQNRILMSTLKKLHTLTHNPSNAQRILSIQAMMDEIPCSSNLEQDFVVALSSNRLFIEYRQLLEWSRLFLFNKGFVTFSGKHINQSFLFPADKLFESYMAFLAKKYLSNEYKVFTQDRRHYLVEDHMGNSLFNLRPDIYLERRDNSRTDLPEMVIIDTKWKRIDENNHKGHNIDQGDMYQMFAYGKKYNKNGAVPNMVLLYPFCETFTTTLSSFIYDFKNDEIGLNVVVTSFNLADKEKYESMLQNIIHIAGQSKEIKQRLENADSEI